MAGSVLTVAQQKGGAGKTTLAIHLAVHWARAGLKVAMVDVDPQGSVTAWGAVRAQRLGAADPNLAVSAVSGWRASSEIEKLAKTYDRVLVDSAPHAETEARIAVRAANLVLAPIQPSVMDLWAINPTLKLAADEKRPVLLVLNRVPARSKTAAAVIEAAQQLGAPIAANSLGNRTALAAALAIGSGVAETEPNGAAGQEIAALAAEIDAMLKRR